MASNEALERSLSLLEEATGGVTFPKLMKIQPKKGLRPSMNNSFTFTNTSINQSLFHPINYSKIRKSDLNQISITLRPNEIAGFIDRTQTSKFLGEAESNLPQLFYEAFQCHGSTLMVYDAIMNFIEICNDVIQLKNNGNRTYSNSYDEELNSLINERNTWKLILALFRDRNAESKEENSQNEVNHPLSEKEIVKHIYKTSAFVRESQMVVDWLEQLSNDQWSLKDNPQVAHFTDKTVAWENTLHQLQNISVAFTSTRELVVSLDPDAPFRESGGLHDLDQDDEQRLLSQVFKEIRIGRLDKAQELCIHCGQAWRAAVLEGWRLHYDPNYTLGESGVYMQAEGNPHRAIWKHFAWATCEDTNNSEPLYRAIIGALCGHLDSLRPFCQSWEDALWAHVKVAIDITIEREIREYCGETYIQLPEKYWNSFMSMDDVFNKLRGCNDLKEEADSAWRVIQELICLNRCPDLITKMSEWAENSDCDLGFLRFMAYIVLILRLFGRGFPQDKANSVIKAYAKALMKESDANLVSYYVSKLDEEDQIEEYAHFLENVVNIEKKMEYLNAAAQNDLNVEEITKRVVQIIWNKIQSIPRDENISKETTEMDLVKINSLDWMIFYPEQRWNALCQANAAIRTFIAEGKLDAARQAYEKIPLESVDLIIARYNCTLDSNNCLLMDDVPPLINSTIKEHLCYRAYLDGQEGFSNWFKLFHSKPSKGKLESIGDFKKQVVHSDNIKAMNEKFDSWKISIDHISKTVKKQLYNILLFPPNGWLVDVACEDDLPQRATQLESLRSLCIPEIVFLLHTLCHKMELFEECLDLCSVVMSDNHQIYKVFNKQSLKLFLEKMSESCLMLSDSGIDDFGMAPLEESQKPLNLD